MFTATFRPYPFSANALFVKPFLLPRGWRLRDWEIDQYYRARRQKLDDEMTAWRTVHLPRLMELEKRRLPLHPDLQREFTAYGGRNSWLYFQRQTRPLKEVAELAGLSREYTRLLIHRAERRLAWRATIKPFDWCQGHRGRPIDMGGPRDEWLEFTAPMALRTPDPRVEDLG